MKCIIESKVLNSAPKSVSILRAAKTIILQSCDVENASEDTIMAAGSVSATYCASNNSDMTNCRNQTGMRGVICIIFQRSKLYHRSGFGLSEFTGKISSP